MTTYKSRQDYVAAGGAQTFTFSFSYIDPLHVSILVNGVSQPFSWLSTNQVQLSTNATAGSTIRVRRDTPHVPLSFSSPSNFKAGSLNIGFQSVIYIAEEASDDGLEAQALTAAQTAVVAGYATAALASQVAADASATTSTTQAGIATAGASTATAQAVIATTQAGTATTKATAASTSAAAALASQTAAGTSATNAGTSATTATTQAGIATTGATTATTQAGTATTQAGIATTGATTATTQAGIATTGATTATTQAGIATTQAGIATTAAGSIPAAATAAQMLQLLATTAYITPVNLGQALQYRGSSILDFKGSGSALTTTGTIAAGSAVLTLASALDFQNGQGIRINNAGPACGLTPPTAISSAVTGATGTTTYSYFLATIDNFGGISTASTQYNVTNGPATLSNTNYVTINWTNSGAGSPAGVVIWKYNGTSWQYFVCVNASSYLDMGTSWGVAPQRPDWIPNTPTGTAYNRWLVTSILSGAGTTSLTLNNTATSAAAVAFVVHDDTAAFNNALAASRLGVVDIPDGTWYWSSQVVIDGAKAKGFWGRGRTATKIVPVWAGGDRLVIGPGSQVTDGSARHFSIVNALEQCSGSSITFITYSHFQIDDYHIQYAFDGVSVDNPGSSTGAKLGTGVIEYSYNNGVNIGNRYTPNPNEYFDDNITTAWSRNTGWCIVNGNGIYCGKHSHYKALNQAVLIYSAISAIECVKWNTLITDSTLLGSGIFIWGSTSTVGGIDLGKWQSSSNQQRGIYTQGAHLRGVRICDGEAEANQWDGILLNGGFDYIVRRNIIDHNSLASLGTYNAIAVNNVYGADISSNFLGNVGSLSDIWAANYQAWGVSLLANTGNIIVRFNRCPGNAQGAVASATGNPTDIASNPLW